MRSRDGRLRRPSADLFELMPFTYDKDVAMYLSTSIKPFVPPGTKEMRLFRDCPPKWTASTGVDPRLLVRL